MADGEETLAMQEGRRDPLPVGWFALFTPDDAMPKDRSLYVKSRGLVIIAALVVIAICWGLGQSVGFAENVYARGFGQAVGRGMATVSGLLPTSIAELAVVFVAGWWLFSWARASWYVIRRKRRVLNAVACGGLSVGVFALVAIALFYTLWGINYFRPGLIERQNWQQFAAPPKTREAQTEELSELCDQLVQATNREYFAAMGTEDAGEPSAPAAEMAAVDAAIERAFEHVQSDLGLEESFAAPRGRAKPVAMSALMNYLHIGGFYFPWTGEANYNRLQPPVSLPFVIAHEKAHQRCVTSEDEANFIGFAACVRADDPYARYSGYLFAQRQLLSELAKLDLERVRELLKERLPGVQRDVDDVNAYWVRLESGAAGTVGKVSTQINDAYLKANQVKGGVESYRMSSKLLIVYYRRLNAGRE
jgi:hypothetical protein